MIIKLGRGVGWEGDCSNFLRKLEDSENLKECEGRPVYSFVLVETGGTVSVTQKLSQI